MNATTGSLSSRFRLLGRVLGQQVLQLLRLRASPRLQLLQDTLGGEGAGDNLPDPAEPGNHHAWPSLPSCPESLDVDPIRYPLRTFS